MDTFKSLVLLTFCFQISLMEKQPDCSQNTISLDSRSAPKLRAVSRNMIEIIWEHLVRDFPLTCLVYMELKDGDGQLIAKEGNMKNILM